MSPFFIKDHRKINLRGNCFLRADSTQEARTTTYDIQLNVEKVVEEGCLVSLLRRTKRSF